MTDQEYADDIRAKALALQASIGAARTAGLQVEIPLSLSLWLNDNNELGGLHAWTIKRKPPRSL